MPGYFEYRQGRAIPMQSFEKKREPRSVHIKSHPQKYNLENKTKETKQNKTKREKDPQL